tara:strand:+ start:1142 stop:1588 length:447 start_codon:yes stop_codon:yes gene_type:complete
MTHFQEAIELQINENLQANEELKKQADPVWIELFQISKRSPIPLGEKTGVYKIYHKEQDEPMVIGEGVLVRRKGRHVSVFNNKGIAIAHSGGSSSPCSTATKMYQYDSNIDNWFFSWCELPKTISTKYETILIRKLKPKFNLQSMAGL